MKRRFNVLGGKHQDGDEFQVPCRIQMYLGRIELEVPRVVHGYLQLRLRVFPQWAVALRYPYGFPAGVDAHEVFFDGAPTKLMYVRVLPVNRHYVRQLLEHD